VYNPGWLPGFDFSADYYNIRVFNLVGSVGSQSILTGCYSGIHPEYCHLIQESAGIISNILNTNINVGELDTAGIDVSTHYKLPSTSVGDFKLGLDWTFLKEFQSINGDGVVSDSLGFTSSFGGFPRQKASLSLAWNYGDWSADWDVKYVHSLNEEGCTNASVAANECSNPGTANADGSTGLNHLGAWFTHNVQVGYHVESWNTDFSFGVRNLFDKLPPAAPNSAFANTYLPALYPVVPGRFFYGRVSVKF
jgi:hypothetical protein